MNRSETGRRGERLALEHLRRQGYRILETNYRSRLGELDIICRDGAAVVFVEVKARTSDTFGSPAEAVHGQKQARLRRLAQQYLLGHEQDQSEVRFDVLAVRLDSDPPAIEHLKGAF